MKIWDFFPLKHSRFHKIINMLLLLFKFDKWFTFHESIGWSGLLRCPGEELSDVLIVKSVNVHNFSVKANKSHSAITISEKAASSGVGFGYRWTSFAPPKSLIELFLVSHRGKQWGMDYVNIDFCLVIYHSLIMTMLGACHY